MTTYKCRPSLPKGKGVKLSILEERKKRFKAGR